MSLAYNALIVNGRSTREFPFMVIVEVNAAPSKARKKDIFHELAMRNGRGKQSVKAWDVVEKKYDIYLHNATLDNVRQFKKFLGESGNFISYDDPNITRVYDQVDFESETLSKIDGYHVHVTFHCEPFEYEKEVIVKGENITLNNHTNAPMWPRIQIDANTSDDVWIQIGTQRMVITGGVRGRCFIECKDGLQDVYMAGGEKINNRVRGMFFIIDPGYHHVIKSNNCTIEILCRWGWV